MQISIVAMQLAVVVFDITISVSMRLDIVSIPIFCEYPLGPILTLWVIGMGHFDIIGMVSIQVIVRVSYTLKHDFPIPTIPQDPFGPWSSTVGHCNCILLCCSSEVQVACVMGVHPLASSGKRLYVYNGVETQPQDSCTDHLSCLMHFLIAVLLLLAIP